MDQELAEGSWVEAPVKRKWGALSSSTGPEADPEMGTVFIWKESQKAGKGRRLGRKES